MKNTSNALRRVMSVVLVFAMMFTSMPTGALAEDVVDPAPSTTAAEPAASETTEPTTPEPASSEAVPAANSAVLPANDGDPAPVTFTVTWHRTRRWYPASVLCAGIRILPTCRAI